MDNAKIHHGNEILELADQFGASLAPQNPVFDIDSLSGVRIKYLPPYLPDLNPIEEAFSKIKAFICRNNDLFQAIEDDRILYDMHEVMHVITAHNASGYFIHVGYF